MKTLTLIIATGALLVAVAPSADARNTLCSSVTKHTAGVNVRTRDPELPNGYQIKRNLQYVGTWHPAVTGSSCKVLQSAKTSSTLSPAIQYQIARDSL